MSPRPYHAKMPRLWFLKDPAMRLYALRELSAPFLGVWAMVALAGLVCLAAGEASWVRWRELQAHPAMLGFNGLVLIMAVTHSLTWFSVAPKAAPQVISGRRVSQRAIWIAHLAAWVVASAAILAWCFEVIG